MKIEICFCLEFLIKQGLHRVTYKSKEFFSKIQIKKNKIYKINEFLEKLNFIIKMVTTLSLLAFIVFMANSEFAAGF